MLFSERRCVNITSVLLLDSKTNLERCLDIDCMWCGLAEILGIWGSGALERTTAQTREVICFLISYSFILFCAGRQTSCPTYPRPFLLYRVFCLHLHLSSPSSAALSVVTMSDNLRFLVGFSMKELYKCVPYTCNLKQRHIRNRRYSEQGWISCPQFQCNPDLQWRIEPAYIELSVKYRFLSNARIAIGHYFKTNS
jgi:hypothetical protein